MRVASLKYRLQLPGFVLPEAVTVSLQAYDEHSAQMLEDIADRVEGKTSLGRPADSVARLEQALESLPLLSGHSAPLVPLLRQIDQLTSRLATQITMESDRPD